MALRNEALRAFSPEFLKRNPRVSLHPRLKSRGFEASWDKYIIGIDLGGSKFSVVLGTAGGKILAKRAGATGINSKPVETLERIFSSIDEVSQEARVSVEKTLGIGVASVGPLDITKGVMTVPPNLPRWKNVPLRQILKKRFPRLPVVIDNDCNACGLAEKYFGAGKDVQNLFYFTVSTGIGGGMIVNGRIHQGVSFDGGEVGHSIILPFGPRCNCGKSGCLEALASGTAIAKKAKAMVKSSPPCTVGDADLAKICGGKKSLIYRLCKGDINTIDAGIVYQAAKRGDKLAKSICDEAAWYLGIGIANVMQIFNPEMVILGGGITKAGRVLFAPVARSVREHTWRRVWKACPVVPARLGDYVGDVGAISLVLADIRNNSR